MTNCPARSESEVETKRCIDNYSLFLSMYITILLFFIWNSFVIFTTFLWLRICVWTDVAVVLSKWLRLLFSIPYNVSFGTDRDDNNALLSISRYYICNNRLGKVDSWEAHGINFRTEKNMRNMRNHTSCNQTEASRTVWFSCTLAPSLRTFDTQIRC